MTRLVFAIDSRIVSTSIGRQRAEVDDLRLDPRLGQPTGGLERRVHHRAERHERHVVTGTADGGLAERDEVLAVRHVVLHPAVEELVLQKQHGIIVPDRPP